MSISYQPTPECPGAAVLARYHEQKLGPEQTLIDLPYPRTAMAEAAAAAGAHVLDGLEVLVAQGAASFELWTGQPAPVDAMRTALGLT